MKVNLNKLLRQILGHKEVDEGLLEETHYESATLDKGIDVSLRTLRVKCGDLNKLVPEMQVVIRVNTVQGVIDNGSTHCLFESNFEDASPYSVFIDAFRTIGANDAAKSLKEAVDWFNFDQPHLDAPRRFKAMENFGDDFWKIEWQSATVWKQLEAYIKGHQEIFKLST